jgi:uncharacterized membrane protein YcaP (DUF421 family)
MNAQLAQWFGLIFSHPDLPGALAIAAKTALIYLFLVVGLRLLGKRELGQMSVYDLVLIVVISNSVQNAMVGSDSSLGGGLIAAFVLLLINRLLTWLMVKNPKLANLLEGDPVLIVRDGELLEQPMRKAGVTRDNVLAAMREHGIDDLDDVQMAVLEPDGIISIVPKQSMIHRSQRHFRGLRVS